MPLVPFENGKPALPHASYWSGCEIVTGGDGVVRILGPHGANEYPPGTTFRDVTIPPHWPPPVEPAEWEDEITDATRERWKTQAHEMNGATDAPDPAVVDALAWIATETRDSRAAIDEWEERCAAAGLEWPPERALKADKIDDVHDAAAHKAADLGIGWGSP